MTSTTDVVQRENSLWSIYRKHGYFFREAAMLTIVIGFCLHLYRVIFGDDATLQYVVTQTTDTLLMIPMTYAAVTGILQLPPDGIRQSGAQDRTHRRRSVYITVSVPLHIYVTLVMQGHQLYVHMAGYWFSYFLLIVVYPVFLTLFAKLQYKTDARQS